MEREDVAACGQRKRKRVEQVSRTLPEELVEKIVAMIPFPSVFKARSLSKSWLTRFSSVSSQESEAEQQLATSFQKHVVEWSKNWETCCLAFVCVGGFIGYNRASQNWRPLPALSFLPDGFFLPHLNQFRAGADVWIEGPLLYGFARSKTEVYVANILTRSWKQLPPRPNADTYVFARKLVSDTSLQTYKLFLFCLGDCLGDYDPCSIYIYDSKSDAWDSKKVHDSSDFTVAPSTAAYLNGVVYVVSANNPQHLLAFNVEKETLEELRLSFWGILEKCTINLLVCNGNRLMVVTRGLYPETLQVLDVDLDAMKLVEVAVGPPPAIRRLHVGKEYTHPVCEGNCIFFREDSGSEVLAYNVDDDEWSCFAVPGAFGPLTSNQWIVSSFQPGLSPFMAV